jgi:GntR family transcriptional regulator
VLTLAIVAGTAKPIYAQIVDQVAVAIRSGHLGADDMLPSVRGVAEQFGINPNTVVKAYAQLESAGLIRGIPGRGFAVNPSRPALSAAEQERRMDAIIGPVVSAAARFGWSQSEVTAFIKRRFSEEGLP